MDGRVYQEGAVLAFSLGDFLVRNDVGVRSVQTTRSTRTGGLRRV